MHPPTFSLAGAPAMIVSGLLQGHGASSLPGLEKKALDQGPGHPTQDECPAKPPASRKRKGRVAEPTLAELGDPYAMPADDEGSKDGKSYRSAGGGARRSAALRVGRVSAEGALHCVWGGSVLRERRTVCGEGQC